MGKDWIRPPGRVPLDLLKRTQPRTMAALTNGGTILRQMGVGSGDSSSLSRKALREILASHFIFFKLLMPSRHLVPGRHARKPVFPLGGH